MPFPEEIVISVSAAAIAISKNLSVDEIVLLGAVFTQLGDTLATIAVTRQDTSPQKVKESVQPKRPADDRSGNANADNRNHNK